MDPHLASQSANREIWVKQRMSIEQDRYKVTVPGVKIFPRDSLIDYLLPLFGFGMKVIGQYQRAYRNAYDVQVKQFNVTFPGLPRAFEEYNILHITDLHLDNMPGLEDKVIEQIKNLAYDLCLITGDYRKETEGPYSQIVAPLQRIIENIHAKDGIYGVLGNHDTYAMVDAFAAIGFPILINESLKIKRGPDHILITGIDDPHHYYSSAALEAIRNSNGDFKVLLSHSPEISEMAANYNYDFCLSGHTHAGQICLPGGMPVVTHLNQSKNKYYGLWNEGDLIGYTSSGCGSSGLPLRINTQSEIALITLKREESNQ